MLVLSIGTISRTVVAACGKRDELPYSSVYAARTDYGRCRLMNPLGGVAPVARKRLGPLRRLYMRSTVSPDPRKEALYAKPARWRSPVNGSLPEVPPSLRCYRLTWGHPRRAAARNAPSGFARHALLRKLERD